MNDTGFDPEDDPDWPEIARLIRQAREKSRGYADFFEWAIDPQQAEFQIAQALCKFLSLHGEIAPGRLSPIEHDPPDAMWTTHTGRRIGIEVTELVSGEAAARVRYLKKQGLPADDVYADWNAATVTKELIARIAVKDRKLAKAKSTYDELLLVVATDEYMIDQACAAAASAAVETSVENIDRAFLLMSYMPGTDELVYPDGYPIFSLRVRR